MSEDGPDERDGTDLLSNVVVPVAEERDARATGRALRQYLGPGGDVLIVNVVEKAGGAPDKASVEQREEAAEAAFAAFREAFGDEDDDRVRTRILYGTDVAEAIFDAAEDVGASAIAFSPREGSRWIRLLTGDVALDLVTRTDRPVLVLPDTEGEN